MTPAILCHGGAGQLASERAPTARAGVRRAAEQGWRILLSGGSALDAVEVAVREMEDNPEFNAGLGSVLNEKGEVECDAAIMDGDRLVAGAVGAVSGVRYPIGLARRILGDGRHVLLVGEGARAFAAAAGEPLCDPDALVTPAQRGRWLQEAPGTVGAVACDASGRLAAATSTGGAWGKRMGRVGDTALIGGGTYADEHAAVSCTGDGEAITRCVLAHVAACRVEAGESAMAAACAAVSWLERRTGGEGGVIVVDRDGRLGHARNAPAMAVCAIDKAGTYSHY